MKKRTKKIIALLLAIVMAISLMPIAALAEGETGEERNGTVLAVVYSPTLTQALSKTDYSEDMGKVLGGVGLLTALGLAKAGYDTNITKDLPAVEDIELALSDGTSDILMEQVSMKDKEIVSDETTGNTLSGYLSGKSYYVYRAELPEGTYSMKVSFPEPYGPAEVVEKAVTVNAGETVLVGTQKQFSGTYKPFLGKKENHTLTFTGYYLEKKQKTFSFRTTDVVNTPVAGAEFTMVNRDDLDAILKWMIDLGKDTFNAALSGLSELDYEEVVALHKDIISTNENGMLSISTEQLGKVIQAYLAFALDIVKDVNIPDKLFEMKKLEIDIPILGKTELPFEVPVFKLHLPAILTATSDEYGTVTFNEDSNVTLTWITDFIAKFGGDLLGASEENGLSSIIGIIKNLTDQFGDSVYWVFQSMNLVGERIDKGHYLLFQSAIPKDSAYARSPLLYTVVLDWDKEENVYATVADLGLIGPYIAEDFYNFVRNTPYEGPVAKLLGTSADYYALNSKLLSGNIDLTKKANQQVLAAFNAFMGNTGFRPLGLDLIFKSKIALMEGLNQYMIDNGTTATALSEYLTAQANKAKSVYAGTVNEDWVFYTLDSSPTTTATKLIQKSTDDITKIMNDSTSYRAIDEDGQPAANSPRGELVARTGAQVKSIVSKIGTRIEETNKKIADGIKEAAKKVFGNIGTQIKTGIEKLVSGLFSNLFGGNKTANA